MREAAYRPELGQLDRDGNEIEDGFTIPRILIATSCSTNRPEWQAAAKALLLVAESGGPTMLARIGMMRALIAPS
jgi:hypothetical protein